MDGQQYLQTECLAPGKQLALASQWDNSIIVCIFRQIPSLAATKLAVMSLSLIRDALLENGLDYLLALIPSKKHATAQTGGFLNMTSRTGTSQ